MIHDAGFGTAHARNANGGVARGAEGFRTVSRGLDVAFHRGDACDSGVFAGGAIHGCRRRDGGCGSGGPQQALRALDLVSGLRAQCERGGDGQGNG